VSSSRSKNLLINIKPHSASLICDLEHIHPELGSLEQTFTEEEDAFPRVGDERVFYSVFTLFAKDSSTPASFAHLPSEAKSQIWDEVFALKNEYLTHKIPDVIRHLVKHPFSIEKRFELYKARLELKDYDIWHDNQNIWLERK
jgi:hypothetical protein